jgi:hypothetical protein
MTGRRTTYKFFRPRVGEHWEQPRQQP